MVIRVLSTRVPEFWEVIKYALQQTERFGEAEAPDIYNKVLAALLNDRAQCFIMQDDEGLRGVMVTEIVEDLVTGKRALNIRCLYAFNRILDDEWQDNFGLLLELAKSQQCTRILFETSNPRVERIGKLVGFNKKSVNMEYKLEG